MIKSRYDFSFSLGESCTCSDALRRLDMQFGSFPFDWGGCGNSVMHARLVTEDFRDLMPIEALEFLGSDLGEGVDKYVNRNNRFHFIHDFPAGVPLVDAYPSVRAKYLRRIARLTAELMRARTVLAMITQIPIRPRRTDDELREIRRLLLLRFPHIELDVLFFYLDEDRPPHIAKVEKVDDGIYKIGFDLRMPADKPHNPFISDRKKIIPILKTLVPRGVRDYRTPEERQAWERIVREKKYRAMHASSWLEYAVNRFNWLMFRHFRNRLEKSGFENLPSHRAL